MKGLYVHIPFCKYICTYCDFCKKFIHKYDVDKYLDYLEKEFSMYDIKDINTIYIGGGTPSALTKKQIQRLLHIVANNTLNNKIVEYSFEMNPDDISIEKLEILKEFGVNRISIGLQTLNNQILKTINRNYTVAQAYNAIDLVADYFDNISIDFMFNLPNQTKEDIDDIINYIKIKNIKHFSFYSLIIEENTVINNQKFTGLNEAEESQMYKYIVQRVIEELNFEQYEISNFAKKGFESMHNIHYWDTDEYYGIGIGASGYLENERYTNTKSILKYYNNLEQEKYPISFTEQISAEEHEREKLILSLRQNKFIKVPKDIIKVIETNIFLKERIIINNEQIKIKKKYYFISNEIILQLLEGNDD